MERRTFIKSAAGGIALAGLGNVAPAMAAAPCSSVSNKAKFTLKYAPPLGMFTSHAGKDPVEQLKFIADQGFRAAYDLGLIGRPPAEQEKIAGEARKLGLELGQFSFKIDWSKPTFVLKKDEIREEIKTRMLAGLEVQKRTGINTGLVVPGHYDSRLHIEHQTVNVIENLRMCFDILEQSGLEIVLEPLNTLTNHPSVFLTRTSQAKLICVAVNHPGCKMVDDLYHQQITEGNLIPNLEACWDYIGSIHVADNPGRNEPSTGEINYATVFNYLHNRNYEGILSMEHGQSKPGKEGELAIINAYRELDPE
ncbi:Hydroxypyruvate isomerase [Bacteroidales bacterium Barb6XT]|nr:Hydroxypyruvate isomerase [Bacteroidales bacterium Barb6XT]